MPNNTNTTKTRIYFFYLKTHQRRKVYRLNILNTRNPFSYQYHYKLKQAHILNDYSKVGLSIVTLQHLCY